MEIPFDLLGGVHSLVGLLTETTRYAADHGGNAFVIPIRLPLYDGSIADDATTVICVRSEAAHKACLDDYASYEAAERGAAKFLRDSVEEVWYNDLKNSDTFYTKVSALDIIAFLDANSGGLHAVRRHALPSNEHAHLLCASRWHPPVHQHAGGCAEEGEASGHAHRRRRTRHDGLGRGARGSTLPSRGG